jgi:AcrR family transcriptional regulator
MAAKKHIDLDRVLQTAIALADEHGFEAVTLAAIAAQLDIRIPSLYNYISGLPGLRYQMMLWGVRQLSEQLRRAAVGKAGADAIISIAHAYRAFAHAHPGIYAATLRAPQPDESDLIAAAGELLDVIVAVLRPSQLNDDDAIHTVRVLRSMMHGFVDLETAGGFGMALDRDESFRRLISLFVTGLAKQS